MIYKMSYKMDNLSKDKKLDSYSFACAMNAIEGVTITNETRENIEKWINGTKSFFNVFEDTLKYYGFIN